NASLVNTHGQRPNRDILERHGSSYVAKHSPDFAFSKDPWFRGLHAKYGPDGGVYVSDWSDTGECHDNKEEQCDKTGGRIFKIVYHPEGSERRGVPLVADLSTASAEHLILLHSYENKWYLRHTRRIILDRTARTSAL